MVRIWWLFYISGYMMLSSRQAGNLIPCQLHSTKLNSDHFCFVALLFFHIPYNNIIYKIYTKTKLNFYHHKRENLFPTGFNPLKPPTIVLFHPIHKWSYFELTARSFTTCIVIYVVVVKYFYRNILYYIIISYITFQNIFILK